MSDLPQDYANLEDWQPTEGLLEQRSTAYDVAWEKQWIELCILMDMPLQQALYSQLERELAECAGDEEASQRSIEEYWRALREESLYTYRQDVLRAMQRGHMADDFIASLGIGSQSLYQNEPHARLLRTLYPNIWNDALLDRSHITGSRTREYRVIADFGRLGGERWQRYAIAVFFLEAVRAAANGPLMHEVNKFKEAFAGKVGLMIPDTKALMERVVRKTEPYYQLARALESAIIAEEEILFGGNNDERVSLVRAVIALQPMNYMGSKAKIYAAIQVIMQNIFAGQYDQAHEDLSAIVSEYPVILAERYMRAAKLVIDPAAAKRAHSSPRMAGADQRIIR